MNAQAIHVPFRGSAPAQIEILAGNVAFLIDNLTGIISHIQSGGVRALAVTSAERHPLLPDVPAMRETMPELANYDVNTWFGLFGPAAMPPEAVATAQCRGDGAARPARDAAALHRARRCRR